MKRAFLAQTQEGRFFMSTHTVVEGFFARLYDRWRARNELAGMDPGELNRIAGDL
jgi:hypothetical protein